MIAAAAASWFLTDRRECARPMQFSFRPMIEVAVLFFGIFATMMPALDCCAGRSARHLMPGRSIGRPGRCRPFWTARRLTWLFSARRPAAPRAGDRRSGIVAALSVATVVFGAVTYIGNGPNLMVKSIADHQKIRVAVLSRLLV